MTSRRCRETAVWLAAEEAGTLEAAERIRLQRHLEGCAECRSQAQGVGYLVQMLRERTPNLSEGRQEQLWQRIQVAPREPVARAPWWSWSSFGEVPRWAWAGAGAFAAVLVVFFAFRGQPEDPPSGASGAVIAASPGGPGSARGAARTALAPRPRSPQPAVAELEVPKGWTLIRGERLTGALSRGLAVKGALELRSENEVLRAAAGTELALGGELKLERGRIEVRSLPGKHSRLHVRLGAWRLVPLGTAYRAEIVDGVAKVEVLHGRVALRSMPSDGSEETLLAAGDRWSTPPAPLATRSKSPTLVAKTRRPPGRRVIRPRPDGPRGVKGAVERKKPLDLKGLERLLLAGKTADARARARAALAAGARAVAPLHTLIAESWIRERRFVQARDAYLAAHRARPKTSLGADALYLAGVLDLERLRKPSLATQRFSRYIGYYRRGRQRQGAHYMLVRALAKAGKSTAAKQAAKRYRGEFPQGRYLRAIAALGL